MPQRFGGSPVERIKHQPGSTPGTSTMITHREYMEQMSNFSNEEVNKLEMIEDSIDYRVRHRKGFICGSCKYGQIMQRKGQESSVIVFCDTISRFVWADITDCNRYINGGQPSLYDMKEVATPIPSMEKKIGITKKEEK